MKKRVFKTTTEYFYDKDGRVVKSIETIEEYEDNVNPYYPTGGIVGSGQVSTTTGDIYKAKGVPYTSNYNEDKSITDSNVSKKKEKIEIDVAEKSMKDIVLEVQQALENSNILKGIR